MRPTYFVTAGVVSGPNSIEDSLRQMRESCNPCGAVVTSDLRVLAIRRPFNMSGLTVGQLDAHNERIASRIDVNSLMENR